MQTQNENPELFEIELLKDFQKINITAVADYIINNKQSIIIGDSNGIVRLYKRECSKLLEEGKIQASNSQIDNLIVNEESQILYILSGGSLYIRSLPSLNERNIPKEYKKELNKNIVKIVENGNQKHRND